MGHNPALHSIVSWRFATYLDPPLSPLIPFNPTISTILLIRLWKSSFQVSFPNQDGGFLSHGGIPTHRNLLKKSISTKKTFFQPKFWPSMEPQQNPQSFRATPCPWDVLGWAASGCAASDQPTHHGRGSGECGATGQGSEWESAGSTFCKIAQVSMIILWKIPTSWNLCGLYSWLNKVIISYIYIYLDYFS